MKCLICYKEFKALTNSHLKRHGITPKEYEEKFGCKTVPEGWAIGKGNPFYGKKHIVGKSKVKSKEYKEAVSKRYKGIKFYDRLVNVSYEDYIEHRREVTTGEKNNMWRGGISNNPYPVVFNKDLKEEIRCREKYKCFICNTSEENLGRNLDIHHIDYDKDNNKKYNLVALCHNCHMITNFNRLYWQYYLSILLEYQQDNQQPSLDGNILEGSETNSRLLNIKESNGDTSAQHLK